MNKSINKFKFKYATIFLTLVLAALSKLIKLSFVIGSQRMFFSGINVMAPIAGFFGGFMGSILCLFFSFLFSSKSALLLAHTGLPNFLAGLYWRCESRVVKLVLPLACMGLFWQQTWGSLAAGYAVLWFIPVFTTLLNLNSLFAKSLSATFIAHAVGSVLWLYFGNITNTVWFALIPVALLERVCLAILMVGMYKLVQAILSYKFSFKLAFKKFITGLTV